MKLLWTRRDLDLVETLTRRVRLLAVEQVAAGWWERGTPRIIRRRLRRLSGAGLIVQTVINAHPLLPLGKPLVSWKPGKPEPPFERVSQRARERWNRPSVPQAVVFAGKLAANLFGSSAGRLPRLEQRDHDLLLSQVYLRYRTSRPKEAKQWLGEDVFPKAGYRIKDPDAFLVGEGDRILQVIDSAGHYSPAQIESFHEHCAERDLPYELW